MGFFNVLKEIANDMKEISKMSEMDFIVDYIEGKKYMNFSFEELLNEMYRGGIGNGFMRYACYVILMRDYYFYDPYIEKKLVAEVAYDLDKTHRYYTKNFAKELQNQFKEIFLSYEKEHLIEIVEAYGKNSIIEYPYKESTFYFTYAFDEKRMINHYSCMAAIDLLKEKYDIEIEVFDLSDDNADDIRAIKNKERMEKIGKTALHAAVGVINQYIPDSDEDE